jgi:hypothetical protein
MSWPVALAVLVIVFAVCTLVFLALVKWDSTDDPAYGPTPQPRREDRP